MNYIEKIQKNFNKAANRYAQHASLQKQIAIHLLKCFPVNTSNFANIMDLGCGNGQVTQLLINQFPNAVIHAADIAEEMLKQFSLPEPHKQFLVNFNQAIPKHYQLIFANMSLQWATDLTKTISFISESIACDDILMMSLPLKNSLQELKSYFGINYFHSLEEITTLLSANHFTLEHTSMQTLQQNFPNTLSALRSIKLIGANSVFNARNHLRGKSTFTLLNITELTYHIGYFVAKKTAS